MPGRSRAYEAIIKGEPIRNINIPESFNVLMRELNGLCLDIELIKEKQAMAEKMREQREEKKKNK